MSVQTWEPGVTTEQHPEAASDDFVDLFVSHYSRLVAALRLGGADAASGEDLAQEAFARTLGHWRRVRHGSNPAGYVYRVAFQDFQLGYASALAWILFMIVLLLTLVVFRTGRAWVHYEVT